MRPDALSGAMDSDLGAGRRPLFVAAAAGSTNTGAIDPMPELAAIAAEHHAWFHVDGAYGAFAALTQRGSAWLAGIELADSVALDPHKWLYQPFECGCLLVREGDLLDQAFTIVPDYLKEVEAARREVNFSDRGFQLTRMCRALKLWVSLRYYGLDAFRAAIDRTLDLALFAQQRVLASERLELLLPTSLGVTCFRRRFPGVDDEDEIARMNAELAEGLSGTGLGLISSTRLRGRFALRLCVLNHTTGRDDVERVLSWLEDATVPADSGADRAPQTTRDRHPDAAVVRLERERVDVADLARLPLFTALSDEQLERLGRAARIAAHGPGESIVRRWDAARDFYVLAEGTVEVRLDGHHVRDLGPGDFFGELAALEWGAGYANPRLATVVATSPVQAIVLSSDGLNALMRDAPTVPSRSATPFASACRARSAEAGSDAVLR
jgi:hypothetical protein